MTDNNEHKLKKVDIDKKIILDVSPYQGNRAQLLSDEAVFNFEDGIPAFEDACNFIIITNDDMQPFLYMKSLDIEELGFVCVDPFLIKKDFVVKIPAADLVKLELEDASDALVLSFVTVYSDPKDNTANLLAPLVINLKNRKGRQIILEKYPVRYKIWEGLEEISQEED